MKIQIQTKRIIYSLIITLGILSLAFLTHSYFKKGTTYSIPSIGGSPKLELLPKTIDPIYLQTNPKWANNKIGGSSEPLSHVGCTICCVSMALDSLDIKIAPDILNKALINNNGYTKRGWLIWEKIGFATKRKLSVLMPSSFNHTTIDTALQNGSSIIAKILLNDIYHHWVLIVGKKDGEYLVKDPLGSTKELSQLSKLTKRIYSIRIINLKT